MSVPESWTRIERWMRQNTPPSAALLGPPGAPEAIAAAEAQLGFALPDELVASLRRHDGLTRWGNVLPEAAPLSVRGIVEQYEIRMDIAPDIDGFTVHHPNTEPWWDERWVPFGDGDSLLQIIDLRPGPGHGRLGLAPTSDSADFANGWTSLGTYLTAVADALETGGPVGEWHPYLIAGDTLWWGLGGETEINGEPLRRQWDQQRTHGE
ncbi:SMI1/KNR4 family protein [Actinoplanes sp. NBC_00393]|uniref:SMI1/KNR4 family protein n=1 Tax=Actinoplanes sp. NBC_00393 TaxID=2975953 RepID=UPI002E23E7B9